MTFSAADFVSLRVVDRPDTARSNAWHVGNRPPLLPAPLLQLPIGSVRPLGWTARLLRLQADGFHGHLGGISEFLKRENNAWLSRTGRGERGWEEVPYWLKGFQDCAFLLGDERLLQEARLWIEGALNSRQPDGWFGPGEERTGVATDLRGRDDLWPNMIMLFCLQSYYHQTGDPRVIQAMRDYFRYLAAVPEERFLVGYWPKMRAGDQLYSIYWLYNRTGEPWLLELAHKTHRQAARWDRDVINWHNVNLAQGFREPATYFLLSQDPRHLRASEFVWRKVRDLYGQVPGGMYGSDENCRPGYIGPRQAVETCGMVEEMFSDEVMLTITGDPVWADRCEDVAFNTFPASMTPDLKALRYLTAPNQPQSDHISKAPGIQNGGDMYHLNPHSHRCCQHNSGHGWPYFVQHLWYATPDNGLAAVLYAPGVVRAKVGDGTEVTLATTTRYPFEETIEFRVETPGVVRFPLFLRLPSWCDRPELRLNGQRLKLPRDQRGYARLDRFWSGTETVRLTLPMKVRFRVWEANRNTVSVDRGPLTYSLQIAERYERHGGTDAWPAWNIFPDSAWNYGLVLPRFRPERTIEVVQRPWPADDQPFEARAVPIALRAQGARIPEWQLDEKGLVHEVQPSPVRSTQPIESITLIPMGAARLRISAFPTLGRGPEAIEWTPASKVTLRASHLHGDDSLLAASDGILPTSSGDVTIPRFTWWDHRGTAEWIEWDLEQTRSVRGVEVYWFDDTGRGQCRVPESWRLLYRHDGAWRPVARTSDYGVSLDRLNAVTFEPVNTDGLRVEVQLQPGFSGGILEWRALP
jgi:hypothetical protein